MSAIRDRLIEILNELSGEKIVVLLNFAEEIMQEGEGDCVDEELSLQEKEMIKISEEEYSRGEHVLWRDVKRTGV
ncbi:MAG TPA: hypothetical protein GXX25_06950 [Desulfotomaculum sp.]|nr:hypothetical protein [Desulfotomaculum sp.]